MAGTIPVFAQRAASEGPRWTRAVGIITAILIKVIVRCGHAWDEARPWAKRLSWQTQGGRVKWPPGLGGWEVWPFWASCAQRSCCP